MCLGKVIIHAVSQFSHLAQIKDTGLHQLCVSRKLFIIQAVTVLKKFFCISEQLLNDDIISHKP